MTVKNDNKAIKAGKKWRLNRKKQLALSGNISGRIPYEELFDEAIENYEIAMSLKTPFPNKDIRINLWEGLRKGKLTFAEVRAQYFFMARKGALA